MRRDRSLIFDELWRVPASASAWVVDHSSAAVEVRGSQLAPRAIGLAAGRVAALLELQGMTAGERCIV